MSLDPKKVEKIIELLTQQNQLLQEIKDVMEKIPNDCSDIPIDTLGTSWEEKSISGLGFVIEDVGGGFSWRVNRAESPSRAAVKGERWEGEFTKLFVKGSGREGQGRILYWYRR